VRSEVDDLGLHLGEGPGADGQHGLGAAVSARRDDPVALPAPSTPDAGGARNAALTAPARAATFAGSGLSGTRPAYPKTRREPSTAKA